MIRPCGTGLPSDAMVSVNRTGRQPLTVASLVATVTGNLYLVFGTLFFACAAVLGSWIPPYGNWVFWIGRVWSRGVLLSSGVRIEREVAAGLDPAGQFIFMPNHQRLYDIPAVIATLPVETRIMAKHSLFRVPVLGWALRLGGFIPVDRKDRRHAKEAFAAATDRLRRGSSVLLFPEETRSLDGRLLPFQRGGFLLALKSGLPVVPVGVEGTLSVRRRGEWRIRPRRVAVRYGTPIDPRNYGLRRRRELTERVQEAVSELARAPLADGGGRLVEPSGAAASRAGGPGGNHPG